MFRGALLSSWMLIVMGCGGDDGKKAKSGPDDDTDVVLTTEDPDPTTDTGTTSVPTTDTGTTPVTDPNAVTYHGEVASILTDNCVVCHQDGGIGPMRLDNYADASSWAPIVELRTQARTMPPWFLTDDGTCGEFHDSMWMSDADLQTLSDWVADGTLEGEAPTTPPTLPVLEGLDHVDWSGETGTFTPEILGGPLTEFDEYRCFEITNPHDTDMFITGYDVKPGNDAIVHHLVGFTVAMDDPSWLFVDNRTLIGFMDDGRPGWPCVAGPGDGVSYDSTPITWAPGQGAVKFPEPTGLRIAPNQSIVLQMHYNLSDPTTVGQSDNTQLQLQLQTEVDREGYMILPDDFLASVFGTPELIPPGDPAYQFSFHDSHDSLLRMAFLNPGDIDGFEILGVMPHMHELGSRMDMQIVAPDGTETCGADNFHWDFGWQKWYFYENPPTIERDGGVNITCEWDSTNQTEPTAAGWGTNNEMCLMSMYIAP